MSTGIDDATISGILLSIVGVGLGLVAFAATNELWQRKQEEDKEKSNVHEKMPSFKEWCCWFFFDRKRKQKCEEKSDCEDK